VNDSSSSDVTGSVGGASAASTRFQRAAETFEAVRHLDAVERERMLAERCGDDAELLVEVRSLLAFHDKPSETLDTAVLRTGVGATIGRYRIADVLGEGGMGTVYLAVQEEPVSREVALKVIKLGMDTRQIVRRFEAERQALAQMEHPNVARVLDAGSTSDGRPYFVMELVRGQPITHACDARKLSLAARLRLFLDVCAAVQHAHQKGVIHRDLKPSNILVAEVDGRPVAKVIDFGIAKALWRANSDRTFTTTTGDAVGTPDYMSPEQAGGADIDVRSDVYALGVILYESLIGMTPLRARLKSRAGSLATVPALDELRRLVRDEDPIRPLHALAFGDRAGIAAARATDERTLDRAIRGDLEAIVMKALALKPSRRYPTVAALSDDLEHHLRNEPVSARAPSAAYHLAKFARRHTVTLVASCLVILAILIGLIVALVGFEQARQDRDLALGAQTREAGLARELRDELFLRDIDRGRQRSAEGKLSEARDLLWSAISAQPDSLEARWALREMMWTRGPFVFFWFDYQVRSIASLSEEGLAVIGCEFRPPALVNVHDGSIRWFNGPAADMLEIAVSPDDAWIACADNEGTVTIWDRQTIGFVRSIPIGAPGRMPLVFDSPTTFIVAAANGDVRRCRIDGEGPQDVIASSGLIAFRIALSSKGAIAVGLQLGRVLLIEPPDANGVRSQRIFDPHERGVIGVAFDRSGTRLGTASAGRDYGVYDLATLAILSQGRVHPGNIIDLAFSADDSKLIMPSWWDTLSIDIATGEKTTLTPLLGARISVSPSARTIAFGPTNRMMASILLTHPEPMLTTTVPERDLVPLAMNLADDSALAANGSELCGIALGGPRRGEALWSIPNRGTRIAAISPDGLRVAVINQDRSVRVLSVPDGEELARGSNAILGEHDTIRFDPSGNRVAFVTRTHGVRLIDLALGTECVAVPPVESEVLSIAFDPRGHRLAVCERSGVRRVFNLFNPETITVVKAGGGAFSAAFAADGLTLAMGQWAGDIEFWDPDANQEWTARGHSALVSRIIAHPSDANLFLTCSDDGTIRVWDRNLKQDLASVAPYGPRQAIRHVDWSSDGTRFHVVGPDRVVHTYSLPIADRLIGANSTAELRRMEFAGRKP
jgi:eukaryotic-like serine/threonine-protein kinase